ncbi:unnamed protein product [Arabidopsis thaliana]|uniref:Uncharacterized protein n=1 Tax=Arabidopsis thaliana TaxID=3702 RepID=A0A5S9XSR3_ARATH|nr:unnamed protein product [Arabidopsis thaliana]
MKQNPKARMEEMKISFYSHMDEKKESDSGKTVLIFDQLLDQASKQKLERTLQWITLSIDMVRSVMKVDRKYELCPEKVTEVIHCVNYRN